MTPFPAGDSARRAGPGKGAEFVGRRPLREPEKGALHLPVARKHATRKVLIIEDNADAADSLRELLELEGHAVEVARTGPDGIALAREHAPDVVLCDIGLPGMSGYDVARTFRADPELSGVPLVAVSGYALPEDLARASDPQWLLWVALRHRLGERTRLEYGLGEDLSSFLAPDFSAWIAIASDFGAAECR